MFKSYGLYSHIRNNQIRSALLLAGFVVLLQALVYAFALLYESAQAGSASEMMARAGHDLQHMWPFAMAAAALWFLIAYAFHQKMIYFATGSVTVERQSAQKLYDTLENLCISRGVPMPQLKIIESDGLNAFASGLRDDQYSISVTRGLIDLLSPAELEAVLAHELTHIRNRDTQLLVVAIVFAGIFSFVGDLLFRNLDVPFRFWSRGSSSSSSSKESKSSGSGAIIVIIIALAIIILSWGLSVLIRFAISRTREYLADAG